MSRLDDCERQLIESLTWGQKMRDQRDELLEALEFYAEDRNWEPVPFNPEAGVAVEWDTGAKARAAIAKARGESAT